jgi:hypothetical protein
LCWDRGLEGVELVEIGDHMGVGAGIVAYQGGMAGPDAEQEAPGKPGLEFGYRRPDVAGRSGPHADDPARHRDPCRRGKKPPESRGKPGVEAAGRPERAVAERFEFGSNINRGFIRQPPCAAPPHADSP